jgi:hypothetical protein
MDRDATENKHIAPPEVNCVSEQNAGVLINYLLQAHVPFVSSATPTTGAVGPQFSKGGRPGNVVPGMTRFTSPGSLVTSQTESQTSCIGSAHCSARVSEH